VGEIVCNPFFRAPARLVRDSSSTNAVPAIIQTTKVRGKILHNGQPDGVPDKASIAAGEVS
jgi:hypothetical protein